MEKFEVAGPQPLLRVSSFIRGTRARLAQILAVDSWFLGISAGIALFVALGLMLEAVLWVRHSKA